MSEEEGRQAAWELHRWTQAGEWLAVYYSDAKDLTLGLNDETSDQLTRVFRVFQEQHGARFVYLVIYHRPEKRPGRQS